jgi:hypothetical protein
MAWSSEWPPIMRTPLGASAMRARSRACICVDVVEERQLTESMTEVSGTTVKRFMYFSAHYWLEKVAGVDLSYRYPTGIPQ